MAGFQVTAEETIRPCLQRIAYRALVVRDFSPAQGAFFWSHLGCGWYGCNVSGVGDPAMVLTFWRLPFASVPAHADHRSVPTSLLLHGPVRLSASLTVIGRLA